MSHWWPSVIEYMIYAPGSEADMEYLEFSFRSQVKSGTKMMPISTPLGHTVLESLLKLNTVKCGHGLDQKVLVKAPFLN